MLKSARGVWRRTREFLPTAGFRFDRPLLLIQSDDWGRVGVRDQEGVEQLRAAGIELGERPYDFYSLETENDLGELRAVLGKHRDGSGRHPCVQMNFVVANVDFAETLADAGAKVHLLPLCDGLPEGWRRPKLLEAYRAGIDEGVFCAALHGTTHFCCVAVERNGLAAGERRTLLRKFWEAGTPYIHWRMPWIGYEYWDPEMKDNGSFLAEETQRELVGAAVGMFAKVFSTLPQSACAPGYRANEDTHRAWAQHGIRVAQNGPENAMPPHFGDHEVLHLSRTVEFEPAVDPVFAVEKCVAQAEKCFARGVPAVVSMHSINLHSTVKDFRSRTIAALDEFFSHLESRHPELLYVHDKDLYDLVNGGKYRADGSEIRVNVTRKNFTKAAVMRQTG